MRLLLFLFFSLSISAQVKGVIKDSISGKPIPFVNVWVENENIGTSSEENGEFVINAKDKTKNLIFSVLGYEKKIVKASEASVVNLNPKSYQLDEILIAKRYETKIIEIGKSKTSVYQAFDNGPKIDVKYFPFLSKYKKTRYIRQVTVETDSKIEDATVKIHFYSVDVNGYPGEELIHKDFIVSVKKGVIKNSFDVTDLNLRIPKTGLFVGVEKILIEKNKIETQVTDFNTNTTSIKKTYFPYILYNFEEKEFLFSFSGGKWMKQTKLNASQLPEKMMVFEPAINLILTN